MEIYFNSCCILTGGAVFTNEHAAAMLRMPGSDLMSEGPVHVQALLGPVLASCTQLSTGYKTCRKKMAVVLLYCEVSLFVLIKESRDD